MSETEAARRVTDLTLEYELDVPPEKVWRAISIPAFREKWLPGTMLADPDPVSSTPGEEVGYRMREEKPPFLESIVTFQVRPGAQGGTLLRIVHRLTEAAAPSQAANTNGRWLMRAA